MADNSVLITKNTIEVKEYTNDHHKAWDEFVRTSSRNGGIFQERDFLSYHTTGKFKDASLLFFEKGSVIAVFPAAIVSGDGKEKIISHPGSSYGGLVYHYECNLTNVLEMIELIIEHYKKTGIYSIEMRLAEPIFNSFPDGELIYLLWHRGFRLLVQEISSCVKLADYKSWETLGRKRYRYYIRTLEKEGVKANNLANIEKVYAVIEKNLVERYHKKPTHSLEELKELKRIYPERIHFWAAEKDDVILGVIVVFTVNKTGVHDFYIARDEDTPDVYALSFLHYKAFEYYSSKGFTWFNFGISSRKEDIKWGILRFKERVGGRATTRQAWILEDIGSYKKYDAPAFLSIN